MSLPPSQGAKEVQWTSALSRPEQSGEEAVTEGD